jgi:hypothetical protein
MWGCLHTAGIPAGRSELMSQVEPAEKEIVVLNQGKNPNFNRVENQWQAVRVEWPVSWKNLKTSVHIILQWFIYVRNYGCIHFRGKIFNLNIEWERNAVLDILISEGFCVKVRDPKDPDNSRLDCIEVLDPEFAFLGTLVDHQFWVNAMVFFLNQLTEKEIIVYNKSIGFCWKSS